MTKNEFLQGLKEELEGRVTHSAIQENIRYYDDYISQEVLKGSTEEEVTESLEAPGLLPEPLWMRHMIRRIVRTAMMNTAPVRQRKGKQAPVPGVPLAVRETVRKTPIPDTAIFIFWISVSGMCAWAQAL